jgi:ABC-type lipoprotein release transport system permease subunit
MELIRYMLTNIARRPVRAAFIAAAGMLSSIVLVFAFALGSRVTEHVRVDTMAKWTGHLWISVAEDFKFAADKIPDYEREASAVAAYLGSSPDIDAAVPWINSYSEMQAGTKRTYVQIQATDFARDKPYVANTEMVDGAFPRPDQAYGIVVTTELASKNSLKVGDSVTLFISSVFGARNAMDFTVTGVCRASAPWYDNATAIRAEDFLEMSELGGMSPFYKVYVKDEKRIPAMVKDLAALAPTFQVKGYRDDDFVKFLLSLGTSNIAMFGSMAMIIFFALLIGINSIIMTNIFDRRDEIGTMRALGFSKGTVRNLFFGESLLELFVGYLAGAALVSALGAYYAANLVRPPLLMLQYMFGMTRMAIDVTPLTMLAPFLLLFGLLALASYRKIGQETEKQAVEQMSGR